MNKEEICEKYFKNKVKPKHLVEFENTTPQGNEIEGYINKKPNQYLGSILITKLNGIETEQFILSMPKIHYMESLSVYDGAKYYAYEKLDGSCLILYPLLDKDGDLLEIVPKSRNTAVADKFLIGMYKFIDKVRVRNFFRNNKNITLFFELYGVLNQHEIFYNDTYIDIRLIGGSSSEKLLPMSYIFLDDNDIEAISLFYGFKRPERFFKFTYKNNMWQVYIEKGTSLSHYTNFYKQQEIQSFPKLQDALDYINDIMQKVNEISYDLNSGIFTEGVVINAYDDTLKQVYVKSKPWDIFEKCKAEHGVPRKFILKEVRKYFDEYGFEVEEIYKKDNGHYKKFVIDNLLEEFTPESVQKKTTKQRIDDIFFDIWDSKLPPQSLQDLCHDLAEENPDKSVVDLMRIFSEKYPQKKKLSTMVFSILTKIRGE